MPKLSKSKNSLLLLTGLIVIFLCFPKVALAATYIVAKDGSGNFTTIQTAVNAAQAGDTVYIRNGVYHEQVDVSNSGTAQAPITISSYPGETAVVDANYAIPP